MMNSEMRTTVTFENPVFNTTERRDYFINEGCFGDDVARALMEQLRSRGYQTDTEPGQEDFGWYFGFRAGDADYQFVIGHRPADGNDPAVWIGWLERKAGLLGTIFGARNRGIQPAALNAIHFAISALPQVSNIRWHRKEDFDAGKEELGQPSPK
ncbi:MAG TPA: hypothetical protein VMF08_20255 [Candidatus Sulfotelmatobacter sp.]|nr:hypothetical protein [Candidatus Sulfotelmatobacter sp.]